MDPNHSGRDKKPVAYVRQWGSSRVRSDTREAAEDAAEADDKVFGDDEDRLYLMMPGEGKGKDRDDVHEERGTVGFDDYFE